MLTQSPLGRCPECGTRIPPDCLLIEYERSDGAGVAFERGMANLRLTLDETNLDYGTSPVETGRVTEGGGSP